MEPGSSKTPGLAESVHAVAKEAKELQVQLVDALMPQPQAESGSALIARPTMPNLIRDLTEVLQDTLGVLQEAKRVIQVELKAVL